MTHFFPKHRVLLIHVGFWLVYSSFFTYQLDSLYGQKAQPGEIVFSSIIHIAHVAWFAYFNFFVLMPQFQKSPNWYRYTTLFVLVYVPSLLLYRQLKIYEVQVLFPENTGSFYKHIMGASFWINHTFSMLSVTTFIAMLKLSANWVNYEHNRKAIENEKLIAELRFLKAQINPHFLFNTLNNLYYLAFKQSPQTPEVIAKLSAMMRYMIYDTNYPQVPMSKEIEYMENYIDLEKLRLNNQIPILFEVTGPTNQAMIVPFIFITFLENAFKHGVSNNLADNYVKVSLSVERKTCVYRVENKKLPKNGANIDSSGIGLQNLMRRLALSYPNKHTLKIQDGSEVYSVELRLNL